MKKKSCQADEEVAKLKLAFHNVVQTISDGMVEFIDICGKGDPLETLEAVKSFLECLKTIKLWDNITNVGTLMKKHLQIDSSAPRKRRKGSTTFIKRKKSSGVATEDVPSLLLFSGFKPRPGSDVSKDKKELMSIAKRFELCIKKENDEFEDAVTHVIAPSGCVTMKNSCSKPYGKMDNAARMAANFKNRREDMS